VIVALATAALGAPPIEVTIPVPTSPPPGQEERFDYCTRLTDAAKGRQRSVIETDDGQLGLRCERQGDDVHVCLVLDPSNWPTRFPQMLGCEAGRARIEVHPYPAWDPAWTLGEPLWLRVGPLSGMEATWPLDGGPWRTAATADDSSARCELTETGDLRVRVRPPVTFGEVPCVLTAEDGAERVVPLRILRRK
jgi:hypothetical protein